MSEGGGDGGGDDGIPWCPVGTPWDISVRDNLYIHGTF